jgi:hypothetical protein
LYVFYGFLYEGSVRSRRRSAPDVRIADRAEIPRTAASLHTCAVHQMQPVYPI